MTNLTDLYVERLTIGADQQGQAMLVNGLIAIDQGVVTLGKAGILTATLAKPTATTDDFKLLTVTSLTAWAHTLALTAGTFGNGGAGYTTATFAAAAGNSITLLAYQAEWYIVGQRGITMS